MKISRADLKWATECGVLDAGQDERLWAALEQRGTGGARFELANVAYYAGALLILAAMGWFFTKAWESLPGLALTGIAVGYAVVFIVAGRWLWDALGLRVPGGLLFTVAVGMTPLAVYGVLRQFGWCPREAPDRFRDFHEWVHSGWIALELATIAAGAITVRFRRFAFLTAPIAVALWYLSMDMAPLLLGSSYWSGREWISIWFGLAVLVGAWAVDRNSEFEDYAFWLYLFGLASFWGGLSLLDSNSELGQAIYCAINIGLIGLSLLLRRIVFIVFGACGVMGYLGHLAYRIFDDSIFFTVSLTFLGLALIAVGVIYQRNRRQIEAQCKRIVPARLTRLLAVRARQ